MKPGDLVKITLQGFINRKNPDIKSVIGTIIDMSPIMPHIEPHPPLEPGPVYELKILTIQGIIWELLVDQRDKIEIINEN